MAAASKNDSASPNGAERGPGPTDVLIIGSGIAGATAALRLARNPRRRVTVVTREEDPKQSNTRWAQGGVVGRGSDDAPETLASDIVAAGAGASSPQAARLLSEEGPRLLQEILVEEAGIPFDRGDSGQLVFGREAAHSRRRVIHVGDTTGLSIIEGLMAALRRCPNVRFLTGFTAVDLITFPHHSRDPLATYQPITCHGAYLFDREARRVHRHLARFTVLATGGLGRIFRNTTNPVGARGDGLAMAHRAGARIVNAEYVQFHPTALATTGGESFLISEAVRGEGGVLLSPEGRAFMADYSPEWKDLAPRDVVARAIHHQMETHGYPHMLLDIASRMPAAAIEERFPNIRSTCLAAGIDITREPIPVIPAAHYFCGGVLVDSWGRSNIRNLHVVGEASCTGVHGANRLASTSLLEGLVCQWGIPLAIYSDRHATFKYNARQKPVPVETTQFARVMRELGIQQIFALSPQAKGRVERMLETFQGRLPPSCDWPAPAVSVRPAWSYRNFCPGSTPASPWRRSNRSSPTGRCRRNCP